MIIALRKEEDKVILLSIASKALTASFMSSTEIA
jgi:hypothetical protein